ncbi:MAG: hypothetical protein ACTS8R_03555 [Arsenophonus sp. NC-QC1-MAG3]
MIDTAVESEIEGHVALTYSMSTYREGGRVPCDDLIVFATPNHIKINTMGILRLKCLR